MDQNWTDYEWLVVVGALVSFAMAWGIGANDVANAFGTSVGAKTITLTQACIIAAFCEFGGAIALGGEVTKTIAGSIAKPASFVKEPEIFAYGMVCALAAASVWVYAATYMQLAVSTTHSIIGAVMGFALVWQGSSAVVWNQRQKAFPYSTGLVPIVCSWFISPLCASTAAAFLFIANRTLVLRRQNSTELAFWMFPVLVLITVFINIFFVLFKGAKNELHWDENKAAWVSAIIAAGCGLLSAFPGVFLLKRRYKIDLELEQQEANPKEIPDKDAAAAEAADVEAPPTSGVKYWLHKAKKIALHGVSQDVHSTVETDEKVAAMHQAAELYNPHTEQVYKYMQVFSACCVSFAHGGNDVANAVGPFAAIYYVYRNWKIASSVETPKWILAMGGAGIVIGLATYGYNIIRTLGVGMAKMTPSRGFCAELATSFVVSLASIYGLPISTTHCIVGAEVGVGICENIRTGTNWLLFFKQFSAWVMTLVVCGFLSGALFAQGVFAPSVTMSKDVNRYETALRALVKANYADLNKTNFQVNTDYGRFDSALNSTAASQVKATDALFNTNVKGYIYPPDLIKLLNSSIQAYKNYSTVTVGYNKAAQTKSSASIVVPQP